MESEKSFEADEADAGVFEKEIRSLMERFPKQNSDTWIKISSAMRPMFGKEVPRRPAVLILFTSESESETFPEALATMLGKCWYDDKNDKNCIFEGNDFQNGDVSSIYSKLEAFVNTSHVVIFRQMEKISKPEYLTVFHNLCDNSYATYKRICYVLTVTLTADEFQKIQQNPNSLEKQKNSLLHNKWSGVTVESRSALIARVSPFTIFVVDENRTLESPIKVTPREVNEAVAQYESYGSRFYETSSKVIQVGLRFITASATRKTKFDEFVTENKKVFPSSKYNKKDMWDVITRSFQNLVSNRQMYPTVLLVVLSPNSRGGFLKKLTSKLESIFDIHEGETEELDGEIFERSLGSLETQTRNMQPDKTQGHICKDVHKLSMQQIQKLISIFPKENVGSFNNTYWIFTISELEKDLTSDNCQQIVRDTLENCFDGLGEYGDGEYLLERMLEFTIFA